MNDASRVEVPIESPPPEVGIELPPAIAKKLSKGGVEGMLPQVSSRIRLPDELTEKIIKRNESMINGLPDGHPQRNVLSQELQLIKEAAEDWRRREEGAAAVQVAIMRQFLKELVAAGDNPDKQQQVVETYFIGEQPGDALLYQANALRLRASRDGAESLLFRLHPRDIILALVVDIRARDERRGFYEQVQGVKEMMREEISEKFREILEGEESIQKRGKFEAKITERLRPLLTRLPPEFLTDARVEDYITTRLAHFKDEDSEASFSWSELLTSAEKTLGARIILDDEGKIKLIVLDETRGLFSQLLEVELAIEEVRRRLTGLQEAVEGGDLSKAAEITGLGEYLKEQVELRNALTELIEARLGVSAKAVLTHPLEVLGSVKAGKIYTKIDDKEAIVLKKALRVAKAAVAAYLVYEAVHLGGDKLQQMADVIAQQLQVAPAHLHRLLQYAVEDGLKFAQQAQAENIPGADRVWTPMSINWELVKDLDNFIRTAPGKKQLYETLARGLHTGAPVAAAIAAGLSLGREKVSSVVHGVTSRFRRRQ